MTPCHNCQCRTQPLCNVPKSFTPVQVECCYVSEIPVRVQASTCYEQSEGQWWNFCGQWWGKTRTESEYVWWSWNNAVIDESVGSGTSCVQFVCTVLRKQCLDMYQCFTCTPQNCQLLVLFTGLLDFKKTVEELWQQCKSVMYLERITEQICVSMCMTTHECVCMCVCSLSVGVLINLCVRVIGRLYFF